MSYINYTTYEDAIGEWTLRREGPDFEDFPGPVPPFGVEAGPPPPPPPPAAAAAPMTPRKPRSALAALSSNLLSPSPSKKKNRPPSFSSSSPAAAPGIGAEDTFAGVWGNFVPFKEMNDSEWEEEKKKGARAVLAEIAARKAEAIRAFKRKNSEREKARYATKKAAKKKAEEEKKERGEEEEEDEEEEEEWEEKGKGKKAKVVKGKGARKNI